MAFDINASHPLRRMFHGLTEHTFMVDLGMPDGRVIDYIADLLVRFVSAAEVWQGCQRKGSPAAEIEALVAEAEASPDVEHRREGHRHVGDFTLFWTGLYPEALGGAKASGGPDRLSHFQLQGKQSYFVASTLARAEAPILRRLSLEFEQCVEGLHRIRREWEQHPPGAGVRRPFVM
jgi:hypothetical protein